MEISINNLSEIENVAQQILSFTENNKIFCFEGNLGAGKTTLIQAICNQLGVEEDMSSPTYSIVNEYKTKNGDVIYHMDLYRLKSLEEVLDTGIEDYFYENNYCFIEWPEVAKQILPDEIVQILIEKISENQRKLSIFMQ